MSELLGKQLNAQKSLKNTFDLHKFPQAHKTCAMKMKEIKKRKNYICIKMLLMEGGSL